MADEVDKALEAPKRTKRAASLPKGSVQGEGGWFVPVRTPGPGKSSFTKMVFRPNELANAV